MSDFEYVPRYDVVQSGPLAGARVRNLTPEEAAARSATVPGVVRAVPPRTAVTLAENDRVSLFVAAPDREDGAHAGDVCVEAVLLAEDPEDGGGLVLHITVDPASGGYPYRVRVYAGEAEEPDIEYHDGVWL